MQEIRKADAFVSTSLQEGAGWSMAEAITLGTPVVGLDLAGIGTLLRRSGVRPVPHKSSSLELDIATAMLEPPTAFEASAWTSDSFRERIGSALVAVGSAG